MFSSCLRQGAHISGIPCSTGFISRYLPLAPTNQEPYPHPTKQVYSPVPPQKSGAQHHPIGAEVSCYNSNLLHIGSARQAQGGYANGDNSIYPRRPSNYRLRASELPSIESLIMFHNTARTSPITGKQTQHSHCLFFPSKQAALAGCAVINLVSKDPVNNKAN